MLLEGSITRDNKLNQIRENTSFKISKLSDEAVIIEDEQKFQEYFLKEKKKVERKIYLCPVNQDFELSLNGEMIEDNQEMIIEKEERVPAQHIPDQIYLKVERTRRRKLVQEKIKNKQNYEIGGWFLSSLKAVGIKGGADRALGRISDPGEQSEVKYTGER